MDGRAQNQGQVNQAARDQHITNHYHAGPAGSGDWGAPDSVRLPAVGRVPVRLRDRTEVMERLRGIADPTASGQVYVLHGLGGTGKTAVAYTVFREVTAQGARDGLWVNSSDAPSLRQGMLAVAADRGAQDSELTAARTGLRAAADLVWDRLDRSDRPWLLVLDNADEPSALQDGGWLRSSPRGIVLVTTRQAAARWWAGAELHHIGVLPHSAAVEVLCDLAPDSGSAEDAAVVADRLGRLPLALTLAGGFLGRQIISPWTMADYHRMLTVSGPVDPIALIDSGAEGGQHSRHLLSRTWELSLDALTAQGIPEATALLRLLACWSGDPLPLSLLAGVELGPDLPASRSEAALRGLLDQSLTDLVPGTGAHRCLRTHGILLASVVRAVPLHQRDALAAAAARQLALQIPELPQRGAPDSQSALLSPHALALLERLAIVWADVDRSTAESAVRCALGLVVALHRSGDYVSALSLADRARPLAVRLLGEQHPLAIGLGQRTVRTLCRLGRPAEAESLSRPQLLECERLFGPDAPITLECSLILALSLWALDRNSEATALALRCVTGRRAAFGDVHVQTLIARSVLLQIDAGVGPNGTAEAGAALVADCARALGPDHPVTVTAELDHAFACFRAGDPAGALTPARRALADHERRFGPEYPTALAARSLLAQVLAASGARTEAAEQMERVLLGRNRSLGAEHPWTRTAQRLLSEYQELR
jgi:hypothetical protein